MMAFYASIAVYTNPGRNSLPNGTKIRDVDEQVQFVKRGIGYLPDTVLQIGSSDGYTLSRFKAAGAKHVCGVEVGKASVQLAKSLYDIDCVNCDIETFSTDKSYSLILMTHVLEHIYHPANVLLKCKEIQTAVPEGFIYVEVPMMASSSSLCPGFFTFEHINYYTRDSIIKSIVDAGYYPVSVVEHYNSNLSPVVGVLASTKPQKHRFAVSLDYENNKNIVTEYRERELAYWADCLARIEGELGFIGKTYIWGAGIHTSQFIANTRLLDKFFIDGLTDTSSLKWGLRQGEWTCQSPESIDWMSGDKVIISSYASENEIYASLDWLRQRGVKTLRLHNIDG
jgi:2-polyprenyl-3-methyl-5-hydroxy-6-metoxy-1,4-benzoquinol methylase